ncbi:DUF2157 domain-containing protein [Sphingobacterium sp. MYb382]|uniref:DUF2157 domain-containing protein n=1 Tax=Sphingobacterium sp. MYb382 TaxID=2745278 RepID=UPI00309FEC12
MQEIHKENILEVARYSDISPQGLQNTLEATTYPKQKDWKNLLRYSLLALGLGFTVTGIVFFFAYNWADLPKFTKLGLVQGLLIIVSLAALSPRLSLITRNCILTGASVLVGLLFAVFGQIYQTGANAYDFFLAWTVFIAIWVLVARFAPLTLGFITLLNMTIILYSQQVAKDWSFATIVSLLFLLNSLIAAGTYWLNSRTANAKTSSWFTHVLVLAAATYATIGIIWLILEHEPAVISYVLPILYFVVGAATVYYAISTKKTYHLAVIAVSLISIVSALLIRRIDNGEGIFLLLTIFIIIYVTLTIKGLLSLQQKWRDHA